MINKGSPEKIIYLIRHARSVYNQAEHEVEELYKESGIKIEGTPEYLKLKFETNRMDCDIMDPEGKD